MPSDEERYSQLCGVATHVTPQTKPQMHNPEGVPVLGGYFQDVAVLLTLNEIAGAIAATTFAAAQLVDLDQERQKRIAEEIVELLDSTGGVTITNRTEIWSNLRTL